MIPQTNRLPLRQTGFGLVEIMVSLVIGMVVTLIITQVFSVFEGQKRSTTGVADAQTNGSLALYSVQREAQMAGYGLPLFDTVNPPLLCTTFTPATTVLSPVTITAGGAGSLAARSDSITLRYGDTPFAGVPLIMAAGTSGSVAQVDTTVACTVGNDALVTNGIACTMTKVNAIQLAGPPTITLASSTNVGVGARLSCLGTWRQIMFSVNSNLEMERREMVSGLVDGVTSVGSEIVAIKAQYGISASVNSNQVVQWVNATAATGWDAPTIADRNLIKAIRVAVVARNGLMEKEIVSSVCSSTTTANPTGVCAWEGSVASPAPSIDLRDDTGVDFTADAPWRHYRYRVFETIIPLRNVIWSKETLS